MSKQASPTLIGSFVVGAVALGVAALAVLGSGRLFHDTEKFVLYFDSDVSGLNVGSAVKFRGVEIGSVSEVLLNVNAMGVPSAEGYASTRIPVIIQLDPERIRRKGGRVTFSDPAELEGSIKAGLRGQLAMESFVTGLLYVKLDMLPGTAIHLVKDVTMPYPELPTLPTPLEEVQNKATQLLVKLETLDLAGLVASLRSAAEGVDKIVNSAKLASAVDGLEDTMIGLSGTIATVQMLAEEMRARVGPLSDTIAHSARSADQMLEETRALIEHVDGALAPDAPLQYQFRATLQEVSNAARSVRVLADSIERNPSILVRGRAAPGDE
jgi:paraquat-inducible protein B